jgi:hypothetical protein
MECTSLIAQIPLFYGKSIKHTTVLKKWVLQLILDTMDGTFVYKSYYTFLLFLYGVNLQDVFIVHFISIAIGHLNHANLSWDYGFKIYFYNPKCTFGTSKKMPNKYGVNFEFMY